MRKTKKMNVTIMALCALFSALSAVLSQVSIPIGPVPINLTHVSIFISVGLLGTKYGTLSQIVFVLMGALGVPVFSGFSGGIGTIIGATGGFIIGYIACAFVTGLIIDRFGKSFKILIPSMCAGLAITYALGVVWFMYITKASLAAALLGCVVPFLFGDALKIILSAVLINRLSPVIQKKIGKKI